MNSRKIVLPLVLITSLFFLWGFVHNLDPILIPHLRKAFRLSGVQSSLVDSAVFIAYFLMALPAGFIIQKWGYKSGIITGLLLFALGSFLFVPAANTREYLFFLGALFIIACGLTILETAANPYVTILGPKETSAFRLNLAQSFNGLATTIAPLIGGAVIFSGKDYSNADLLKMSDVARNTYLQSEANSVKLPYIILGTVILLVAVLFYFTKLQDIRQKDTGNASILSALRHRHLSWAVVAQFFYIGAQVCVQSFFIIFVKKAAGIDEKEAAKYLGFGYGFAFVCGRFIGTFLMKYIKPQVLLTLYALMNILLTTVAIFAHGMITVYALIGVAFFMSIMFPTIFALGIKDLKQDTKMGSSLIIMSIAGGALLPPVLGWIFDVTGNIQNGYLVPLICFVVIFYFGWKGYLPSEKTRRAVAEDEVNEQLSFV